MAEDLSHTSTVTLNNGVKMPRKGNPEILVLGGQDTCNKYSAVLQLHTLVQPVELSAAVAVG